MNDDYNDLGSGWRSQEERISRRKHRKRLGGGASALSPLPFQSVFVTAGDSLIAHSFTQDSTNNEVTMWGFTAWAQMLTGHRAFLRYNAGISGNTSVQLAARYSTDVIAKSPAQVELSIGSNDMVTAGSSNTVADTCIANVASFISQNRAIGARTLLHVMMPRGQQGGASQLSANQIACFNRINAAYLGFAAVDVIIAGTTYEALVGIGNPEHSLNVAYSSTPSGVADYTHLNPQGAYITGIDLAAQMANLFVAGDILFQGNAAVGNININGQMSGTSGTTSFGVLPTGYVDSSTPGGATYTYDIPARTDAFGNDIRCTISGTYTGNGKFIRVRRAITITGANIGDIFEINGEVTMEGAQNGAVSAVGIATVIDSKTLGAGYNSSSSPTEPGVLGPYTATLRSLPLTVVTTAPTSVNMDILIFLKNTATVDAISAAIRFGRLGYLKRVSA